eukprot:GABW01002100.1.p1 GENE.GABW01002100.1~~GABW01002100.1.p1  ORF type:complete len:99 (+),score=8.09 GABW01002100.1:110-406(+)
MATSMAIGFIFMGGCTHTFRRDVQARAVLFTSVLPLLPMATSDNSELIQPARHLYVLAAVPMTMELRDTHSNSHTTGTVEITLAVPRRGMKRVMRRER